MNQSRIFIFFFLYLFSCFFLAINTFAGKHDALDSVLAQLDKSIIEHEIYSNQREARIVDLKEKLSDSETDAVYGYNLNMALFNEYKSYVCDSAIHYLNRCVKIARELSDSDREYESKLKLAFLMASTGMYLESVELLSEIKKEDLPAHLVKDYYYTNVHVYGELSYYTQNKEAATKYRQMANDFRELLMDILPAGDELRLNFQESNRLYTNRFEEALKLNDIRLAKAQPGTPEYAVATWCRSCIYQRQKDVEKEKYYLALSALSDIQSATKDHASLWTLAQLLYKEEDITRAYNYIRFSWSETVFYNARLRSLQSAVILSLIDKTYQATIERQKSKLQNYLILISALSILLVIAFIYIYLQIKRLFTIRKNLQIVNRQLQELNKELKSINETLQLTNIELSESNQIKEVYIVRFMKLCSTYIDKLDEFRRMVNKKIESGKIAELQLYTKSQDILDDAYQDLYVNFDTAFLRIFPSFVDKVNELLSPDDKFVLKDEEMLNTELRILALVRLGIQDSSQIADFLHYSVTTIYNYRTKMRNRAISRDNFENNIMLIR